MDTCIEWQHGRTSKGYGSLRSQGKTVYAHRVMYELVYGPIPDGAYVLHSCDNPPCVNPVHLRAGSAKDNVDDMVSRGRAKNGAIRSEFCRAGHDDWYVSPSGQRQCRACHRKTMGNVPRDEWLAVARNEECAAGHTDWYIKPDGQRQCRACKRAYRNRSKG
jgi:hypothetical protein